MKTTIKTIFLFSIILLVFAADNSAQQWSDDQKEVWAGVEKYWQIAAEGNTQGFLAYFDESYMGWNNQSRVPQNKSNTSKWVEDDMKDNSSVLYNITPLTIWVKDDFAFVHYAYSQLNKNNKSGEKTPSSGIWTDILMKKDGRWVLIGDHGGRTSSQKNAVME